ncbi:MAG: class I SAM-dependent methyltransferase [Bacilli bacterium]|nr:class I SAM-dependent methyltransferase [Bacilli bacterium]
MNTIDYYNENAKKYFDKTVNADMTKQYDLFLKYVKENGKILDFGCGSGRDSLVFKNMGYDVYPIDGSEELCKLASAYTGLNIKCMDFSELSDIDFYDGIWACSTLLHVKRDKLLDILIKLRDSLKHDGYLYTSFVNGYDKEEYKSDGRYFNDLTSDSFSRLSDNAGFKVIEHSINKSQVSVHNNVLWNSYILRRK